MTPPAGRGAIFDRRRRAHHGDLHAFQLCASNELPQLKRQVIDQCLYRVGLNPMTVELCDSVFGALEAVLVQGFLSTFSMATPSSARSGMGGLGASGCRVESVCGRSFWCLTFVKHMMISRLFQFTECQPKSDGRSLDSGLFDDKSRQTANSIPTQSHWNLVANGQVGLPPEVASAIHQVVEQHRPFHWRIRFPEVFEAGGFDLMVGNPPFINQLVRGKALPRHVVAYLAHTLNMTVGYADVASLIMLWVSRFLKSNGIVSMVQPLSIVMTDPSQPVRMQLLKSLQLRHIWATGNHIFDDAMVFAVP